MRKDLNDARDLHGQAESAAAVWKASRVPLTGRKWVLGGEGVWVGVNLDYLYPVPWIQSSPLQPRCHLGSPVEGQVGSGGAGVPAQSRAHVHLPAALPAGARDGPPEEGPG